MIILQAS